MSSTYRQNVNNVFPGPLTTLPMNEPLKNTYDTITSCEQCSSIYETAKYRSDFDKAYLPIYLHRLAKFDTNPLNLKFEQ
jgi:hypothetical protein